MSGTLALASNVAVVPRKSWNRKCRTSAFGQSFISQSGQVRSAESLASSCSRSSFFCRRGDSRSRDRRGPSRAAELAASRSRRSASNHSRQGRRADSSRFDRFFKKAGQLRRYRQDVRVPALRGVVIVRAAHRDRSFVDVDVALAQAEKLALAQAGVDRAREERTPLRCQRGQEQRYFAGLERVEHLPRHLAPLHCLRRILALPDAARDRASEDSVDVSAEPVEALRRKLVGHALQSALDPRRSHFDQRELAERRQKSLARERLVVSAQARAVLLPPPLKKLCEGELRRVLDERLETFALPLCLALEIVRVALGIALRAAGADLLTPPARGVLPAQVVVAVLLEDAGHGYLAPQARPFNQARTLFGANRSIAPMRMQGSSPRSAAL